MEFILYNGWQLPLSYTNYLQQTIVFEASYVSYYETAVISENSDLFHMQFVHYMLAA